MTRNELHVRMEQENDVNVYPVDMKINYSSDRQILHILVQNRSINGISPLNVSIVLGALH